MMFRQANLLRAVLAPQRHVLGYAGGWIQHPAVALRTKPLVQPGLSSISHSLWLHTLRGNTTGGFGPRAEPTTSRLRRQWSRPIAPKSESRQATASTSSRRPRYLFNRTRRKTALQVRAKSSNHEKENSLPTGKSYSSENNSVKASKPGAGNDSSSHGQGRRVLEGLPSIPKMHRLTKEELLAAATGFWSRLRIRFKWFSIRSARPFNMDDISAFFSWLLVGHVIWILVGTTTFFSLVILAVNTVFAQGVKVVFESAIVPKWKDGVISFKNVFVSRRPGQNKSEVRKGSQTAAAAAAAAELASERADRDVEDSNYTQYDVSIETVNVTLSFAKWFNGHGLLRDVEVKGVRGVIDRTAVHWTDDNVDPRSYRHEHDTGDFEIESFKMEDLLVSVYQPDNFRPFSVSIFTADLPQLRKQWLFYDFLAANHMSGSIDGSLFTIHPRQTHNYTGAQLAELSSESDAQHWKKQSHFRIDGLRIDHLNRGVEGPFSWIDEGQVDIVANISFPADEDESLVKVVTDFYDRVEAQVLQQRQGPSSPVLVAPSADRPQTATVFDGFDVPKNTDPPVVMDLSVTLNSVHASVPLFTRDLGYINSALIRPIVAYINSQSNPAGLLASQRPVVIPVTCRVVKPLSDFEGSWTIYDSGLMQDLSRETYEAFVRGIQDQQTRARRIKRVGFWGLQMIAQALVLGLAGQLA